MAIPRRSIEKKLRPEDYLLFLLAAWANADVAALLAAFGEYLSFKAFVDLLATFAALA